MADQLLSQADVDALVASLSRNDAPKPAAPPVAAPAPKPSAPVASKPSAPPAAVQTPAQASSRASTPFSSTASRTPSMPNFGNMAVVSNAKPAAAPVASAAAPAHKASPAPVAGAPSAGNDSFNALNARVAELTRQLNNMGALLKKVETLEKKLADMEAKTAKANPVTTDLKIQQLTDEMKKIVTNLKGTPGYAAKNTFTCEKCDDHGHVAVQYRCTKCGHERWYGWFPERKSD